MDVRSYNLQSGFNLRYSIAIHKPTASIQSIHKPLTHQQRLKLSNKPISSPQIRNQPSNHPKVSNHFPFSKLRVDLKGQESPKDRSLVKPTVHQPIPKPQTNHQVTKTINHLPFSKLRVQRNQLDINNCTLYPNFYRQYSKSLQTANQPLERVADVLFYQLLLHIRIESIHEFSHIAFKDSIELVEREVDAVIGDAILREVVGADSL